MCMLRRRRRWRLSTERLLGFVDGFHFHVERDFVFSLNDFREGNEAVHELLTKDFPDDILVVIVPKSSGQFVIVHVVLVLPKTPQSSHFFCIQKLELAVVVGPCNYMGILVAEK